MPEKRNKRSREYIERHSRWIAPTTVATDIYPVVFQRGKGVCLWDIDGNEYLDFTSQVGVLNTGHGHPHVQEWIDKTRENFSFIISNDFLFCSHIVLDNEEVEDDLCGSVKEVSLAKLGEEVERITPGDWRKKILPDVSGAAGNIAAIELIKAVSGQTAVDMLLEEWSGAARRASSASTNHTLRILNVLRPKRKIIIAFEEAFHGRKGWAKALTKRSKSIQKRGFTTTLDVRHVPFPVEYLTKYKFPEILAQYAGKPNPEEILAVVFEPIQGEGGINVPKEEAMKDIQNYCRENDILMIADEVQTGFGRTGKFFACEHFGIEPDIMVLAKGVASGEILSLTVYPPDKLFGEFEEEILKLGWHSGTYPGAPVPVAAALGTIEAIEKFNLLTNAETLGTMLSFQIDKVCGGRSSDHTINSRGRGLMRAVDFVRDNKSRPWPELRDKVIKECLNRGLLLLGCGISGIRFLPPLIVTKEEIIKAMEIFGESIDAAVSQMSKK